MANITFDWVNPATFTGNAYFGIPWMLTHAFIGGLAAYALNNQNLSKE